MRNAFKLLIGKPLKRIELFYWGHFSFITIATFLEYFDGAIGFLLFPKLIILGIFYRLLLRTQRKLHYSYWSFSVILLIYIAVSLNGIASFQEHFYLSLCYLLAMVFLSSEMYSLFSPVYYPLIRWWEYDFRYRDDLKVTVDVKGEKLPGRLTDLRRGAGCVALFAEHHRGALLKIDLDKNDKIEPMQAIVVSRRQYSLGRPYTYGVKFKLPTENEKKKYYSLVKHWKNRKRLVKKLKYSIET